MMNFLSQNWGYVVLVIILWLLFDFSNKRRIRRELSKLPQAAESRQKDEDESLGLSETERRIYSGFDRWRIPILAAVGILLALSVLLFAHPPQYVPKGAEKAVGWLWPVYVWRIISASLAYLLLQCLATSPFIVPFPHWIIRFLFGKPISYVGAGLHFRLGAIGLVNWFTVIPAIIAERGTDKEGMTWAELGLEKLSIEDGSTASAEEDLREKYPTDDDKDRQKRHDALATSWVVSSGGFATLEGEKPSDEDEEAGTQVRLISDPLARTVNPVAARRFSPEFQERWWTGIRNQTDEVSRRLADVVPLDIILKVPGRVIQFSTPEKVQDFIDSLRADRDPDKAKLLQQPTKFWSEFLKQAKLPEDYQIQDANGEFSKSKLRKILCEPDVLKDDKGRAVPKYRNTVAYFAMANGQALFALRVIDVDLWETVQAARDQAAAEKSLIRRDSAEGQRLRARAKAVLGDQGESGLNAREYSRAITTLVNMFVPADMVAKKAGNINLLTVGQLDDGLRKLVPEVLAKITSPTTKSES